jgi:hypothetical protein
MWTWSDDRAAPRSRTHRLCERIGHWFVTSAYSRLVLWLVIVAMVLLSSCDATTAPRLLPHERCTDHFPAAQCEH